MNTIEKMLSLKKVKVKDIQLEGVQGSYRFDVGKYHVRVALSDGVARFSKSRAKADCEIQASEEDFDEIALGRRNLLALVMQGRVRIKGDVMRALKFSSFVRHRLLAGPIAV
jgi:putative sterol carrier protein